MTDEDEKAAESGKQVCQSCGDWLPLELHEYRCAGKGNHYAVRRDSVFPDHGPPPLKHEPPKLQLRAIAVALVLAVFAALAIAAMLRGHS